MKKWFVVFLSLIFSSLSAGAHFVDGADAETDSKTPQKVQTMPAESLKNAEEPKINAVLFKDYIENLQNEIRANWQPPQRNKSSRIVARFSVAKNGQLLESKIAQSSNNKKADCAALAAIEKSAPFSPLPDTFSGPSIDIEFTFDYNVYAVKASAPNCGLSAPYGYNEEKMVPAYLEKYQENLKNTIKSNWNPEKDFENSKVAVKFVLAKDGSLISRKISESSNNQKADDAALAAIGKSAPFEPFPAELDKDSYEFEHIFGFNLVVSPQTGNYIDYVNNKIQKNWHPGDCKTNEMVVLSLTLSKDGALMSKLVEMSSGNEEFEEQAIKAVEKSAPFAPFPESMKDETMTIRINFSYDGETESFKTKGYVVNGLLYFTRALWRLIW